MRFKRAFSWLILMTIGFGALYPLRAAQADQSEHAPHEQVSAYDLIIAMNTLRVSNGHPALIEDPIINAVAQSTAQTMAENSMSWHIGDVRGRIAAAGYGGGAKVWATENFAVGFGNTGIDEVMQAWADPDHMRPAVNPAYCHVGAGVAQAGDGRTGDGAARFRRLRTPVPAPAPWTRESPGWPRRVCPPRSAAHPAA